MVSIKTDRVRVRENIMKKRCVFVFAFLTFTTFIGFQGTIEAQNQLERLFDISRLPYLRSNRLFQISSYDTTGGNADRIAIPEGKAVTIARIEGPGCITRIWLTVSCKDRYFLRRILMRMYWDGEENPSVEVPVGDFFGTGFEYTHYTSLLVGMTSGGYYCYIPMPFSESAVIEVVNECECDVDLFYYHIDYQELDRMEEDVGRFHAQWRREVPTTLGTQYTILDADGWGHFIGCNLNMQGYTDDLSFLEGDEMIYVDGEDFPSIYGTGTEDYFSSGWYFTTGAFDGPLHGLIMKDEKSARIAAYRFHINDCIPFQNSIVVTIEHGHANTVQADYSSVAYWYQKEPHKPFAAILPAPMRIPLRVTVPLNAIEGEDLLATTRLTGGKVSVESMNEFGPEWSGGRQFHFHDAQPEDQCEVTFDAERADRYFIHGYFTRGPSYGQFHVSHDGHVLGHYNGYADKIELSGKVDLGKTRLMSGKNSLIITVTGKDDKAIGCDVGLDCVALIPVRDFIRKWSVVGPFNNPTEGYFRKGIDIVYAPEQEIDVNRSYAGKDGIQALWKTAAAGDDGYINLNTYFEPNELTVAYGLSYVHSPRESEVAIYLGSDDGVKLWINDEMVHRNYILRPAKPDQDTVKVVLREGWNKVLMKVEDNLGGWGFYVRIPNAQEDLEFNTFPKE